MKSDETRGLVEAELIEDDKKMIWWLTVIDGKAYVSNHKCKNVLRNILTKGLSILQKELWTG